MALNSWAGTAPGRIWQEFSHRHAARIGERRPFAGIADLGQADLGPGLTMLARLSDELCLLSTKEFVDVEVIDGGDTVVVKFEGADCRTVGVMMSRRVMQGMVRALGGLAAEAEPADRLRLGTEASGG